jgi:hypothetical protein
MIFVSIDLYILCIFNVKQMVMHKEPQMNKNRSFCIADQRRVTHKVWRAQKGFHS